MIHPGVGGTGQITQLWNRLTASVRHSASRNSNVWRHCCACRHWRHVRASESEAQSVAGWQCENGCTEFDDVPRTVTILNMNRSSSSSSRGSQVKSERTPVKDEPGPSRDIQTGSNQAGSSTEHAGSSAEHAGSSAEHGAGVFELAAASSSSLPPTPPASPPTATALKHSK